MQWSADGVHSQDIIELCRSDETDQYGLNLIKLKTKQKKSC